MRRIAKAAKPTARKQRQEWPPVVYVWMGGLGLGGYVVARLVLDAFPHPIHWASGLAGALLGGGIGWLWYQRRGDII